MLLEDEVLGVEVWVFDPAVESAFTQSSGGVFLEIVEEGFEPDGASFVDFPWVESEGGEDEAGVFCGKCGDGGPVCFGGAIDDAASDADGFHFGDELILFAEETWVLEVIMGVDHVCFLIRSAAAFSRSVDWQVGRVSVTLGLG